ncbi:hypothetical protein KI688_006141 [Linnemannia hyalina]|uniref:WIBG Mago-binding domain-containing protein n=1 Tax=Linnemannia hyalina TaxID=64524 RepID=A0A9P8BZN5_9FUNG|nr:hypothetical protein KI688_006141 [Linnemannia hyalina]
MAALTPKTISGIQEREDERVIPMTRRPDGTFRKERKVRPGYTPPEDVTKYTNRVLESVRPTPPPPPPPPVDTTPKSKAQLKNDKRKAKRKEEAVAAELAGYPTATATNNNDTPKSSTTTSDSTTAAATDSTEAPATGPVDPEKKLRALNKKLRQVEQLKERQAKGETMLPEQLEKIDKMDDLLAQIAELSL